jgi:hypothetical protein
MKNYKKLKITTLLTILLSFVNIFSASSTIPFESSYVPMPQTNTLFRGANIYDGEGNEFLDTDLLIKDGKINGYDRLITFRLNNTFPCISHKC